MSPRRETPAQAMERIESYRARRPRLVDKTVTLAHGAGGKASAALIDAVFIEAFDRPQPAGGSNGAGIFSGTKGTGTLGRPNGPNMTISNELADSAIIDLSQVAPAGAKGTLAFTTDSYVVSPIRFPGGSIADLAVNGTVNDLAVVGAQPIALSCAFVIEEGLEVAELKTLAQEMRRAADLAQVHLVTGDTKVVPKGAADKVFITTSGIGLIPPGRRLGAAQVQPRDEVIISGPIGAHGMAVMMARGNLALEADIKSDSAPVNHLVEALLEAVPQTRWLRDATRGGLGTVANELAQATTLMVLLDDTAIPVEPQVRGACDMLGIDPLYVANEGCLVGVVAAGQGELAVRTLAKAGAAGPAVIGQMVDQGRAVVGVRNAFGGTRLVDMLVGDPLPRIC